MMSSARPESVGPQSRVEARPIRPPVASPRPTLVCKRFQESALAPEVGHRMELLQLDLERPAISTAREANDPVALTFGATQPGLDVAAEDGLSSAIPDAAPRDDEQLSLAANSSGVELLPEHAQGAVGGMAVEIDGAHDGRWG